MKTLKMPAHSLHLFVKIRFSTFFMVKRWPMNYTDFQDKDFFHFLRYIFFFEDRQWRKKWKCFLNPLWGVDFLCWLWQSSSIFYFVPCKKCVVNIKNEIIFFQKVHFYKPIFLNLLPFSIYVYVGQSWHLTNWICIAVIFRWVCTVPYINTM